MEKTVESAIQEKLGATVSLNEILEEKLSRKYFIGEKYGEIFEKERNYLSTLNYRKRGRPLKNQQ